jgi:beta-xylosidase
VKAARGALLIAALTLAAASKPPTSLFTGADPDANRFAGRFWIYPTGAGGTLRAWSSRDLVNWHRHTPLLRLRDIGWRGDGAPVHYLWAPDMVAARGGYFLYYALGPQNPTPSRIGVARCRTPAGPCRDSGRPLLMGGDGFEAIDPMVFHDIPRHRWLLYAGGSAGARLRVFQLGADMVTIDHEIAVDQPPGFTEGAFVHRRHGLYYLSYSEGRWNDASYRVRYVTARAPTGPWRDGGMILSSDARYRGPGHHSFVHDPTTGRWWIVYHRWEGETGEGPYSDARRVAIAPLRYAADGAILPIDMEAPPPRAERARHAAK